jgi:hypothetical protein
MSLSQEERMARRKRNRMAGDSLNEDTAVSEAASDAVATSEQNKSLADRFGQDFVDEVKVDGRQDGNKYSRKELAAEFRYGRGDTTVDDTVAKFQGMVDSGKYKGNNKAQEFLEMHGVNFGDGGDVGIPTPTPEIETPVTNGPGGDIDFDMGDGPTQTINPGNPGDSAPGSGTNVNVNQDNDIINNVSGNGNDISNNQDNSVNTMGGNSQSYNGKYGSSGSMFKDNWMQNFFS